jgi:hypothetical protein
LTNRNFWSIPSRNCYFGKFYGIHKVIFLSEADLSSAFQHPFSFFFFRSEISKISTLAALIASLVTGISTYNLVSASILDLAKNLLLKTLFP